MSSTAWLAFEIGALIICLALAARWLWECERTEGPGRLARQRTMIGLAVVALGLVVRLVVWRSLYWP